MHIPGLDSATHARRHRWTTHDTASRRGATRRMALVSVFCWASTFASLADARSSAVQPDSSTPPLTYHGLIPGVSTAEEVRTALGEPTSEAPWRDYKLMYRAEGRTDLFDAVHLQGREGTLLSIEAASVPKGYETRDKITARFHEPEQEVRMSTFALLDYSAQGVRFVLDRQDRTIGVAYFPHRRSRVHSGARRLIDLSQLRQGPQPQSTKQADIEGLKAGAAEIAITPPKPVMLHVRNGASEVHDDLKARCVVFERGGTNIALVGADLRGLSFSDVQPIRDRVAKEGVQHLILATSHNRSAPDTIGLDGNYPAEYIAYLQDQIVKCAAEAHAKLQPVKELRAAVRELPMYGARVIGHFRNTRNVGLVDPTISILEAIGNDDKPIATIVNFACQVDGLETEGHEISADFPGYLCDQIRQDGGGQAVFLNGAMGGALTGDGSGRTHDDARSMGRALAHLVKELADVARPPEKFEFAVETRRVEIPVTTTKFAPLYSAMRPLERGRVASEMTLVRLGEAQIVTLPGELLPEVSWEIQEKMSGFPRMLVGPANDDLGNIVPEYDYRDDGDEEAMSQGPATAPIVRDTAIRLLTGQR